MAKKPPDKSRTAPAANREDRLKAALKANMARRKAQARARQENVAADISSAPQGQDEE